MPQPKPVAGDKLAKQITKALDLIERSWRNEMRAMSKPYTTDADRRRERSGRQDDQGRKLLADALGQLAGAYVFSAESYIADQNELLTLMADEYRLDPAELADVLGQARKRRRRQ